MQKKILFLACFFICADCFAQQYPFVHYTPKDGLVNSRVRKVYQDSKGRIYFLTFGGLSMYDGARFKNYTTQNGLINDLVNDVLEVGEDSLLVAVNTCGLNILVRGQMKSMMLSGENCPVVNHFLKSPDGKIYATADDGLYILEQNHFKKLPAVIPTTHEEAVYLGIVTEYRDYLIFTTNDLRKFTGLFLYNKKTGIITDVIQQLLIFSLTKDRDGVIWLSSADKILNLDTSALLNGKLVPVNPYASFLNQEALHPGNINFNLQNEPFIASSGKGIIHHRKNGTQLYIDPPELNGFGVQNFFIDRENVIWICHDGNGVYKLSDTKLQSADVFFGGNKSGVRVVRAISPDSCGILMNNGQLILQTAAKTKKFTVAPTINFTTFHYNERHIYAAYYNKLFIAPMPDEHTSVIRFRQILALPDSTSFGGRFVNDPYGNTILFEQRNICVIQNEKLLFTYPLQVYDLIEGMYIDKQRQLWVVSRGNRLQVFSIHPENTSQYLRKERSFDKEFEKASPRCIAVDKNQILWVGTRYSGLMGFEYKNSQLTRQYHFQTQNGLTDNFITSLACDKQDNILVATQTGLDRLLKIKDSSYRLENVTKSNNIFFFITSVWTNSQNDAFALTNSGSLFRVEAAQNLPTGYEPQLLIEEIKVNGQTMPDFRSFARLGYLQRNITFSVAAPTFLDEKQVKYSYLLSGSGTAQWSDTSSKTEISLLNLSPGNYTLHVKAFFHSTAYTPKEIAFSFLIAPPWWQTVLFRLIAATCIMGLLIIITRLYYRRKLQQQRVKLEKQQAIEKERTRIATDMHDDLGAGLSRIKFLSETIGIKKQKQQPIEEDISKIREYSHEMIDKMGEIVWALNEKNDSLSDLLSYTRSYAAEYLSQNGILCTVNLPEHLSSAFVSGEFRRNIFLAVKEVLHNVVKHSQANHVTIEMKVNHDLLILIQDDGTGFDRAAIRPFSNGLMNIEKRMKEIGGVAEIQGVKGTMVKLKVPLFL